MKKLMLLVVVLAACGGGPKKPTNTSGEVGLDPTLPSWVPASCRTYQKAVFQAINCDKVETAKRDAIEASYQTASTSWKAEQNADTAKIEEVNQSCTSSAESVRVEIGDLCVPPAE